MNVSGFFFVRPSPFAFWRRARLPSVLSLFVIDDVEYHCLCVFLLCLLCLPARLQVCFFIVFFEKTLNSFDRSLHFGFLQDVAVDRLDWLVFVVVIVVVVVVVVVFVVS